MAAPSQQPAAPGEGREPFRPGTERVVAVLLLLVTPLSVGAWWVTVSFGRFSSGAGGTLHPYTGLEQLGMAVLAFAPPVMAAILWNGRDWRSWSVALAIPVAAALLTVFAFSTEPSWSADSAPAPSSSARASHW